MLFFKQSLLVANDKWRIDRSKYPYFVDCVLFLPIFEIGELHLLQSVDFGVAEAANLVYGAETASAQFLEGYEIGEGS